jgi:ferredoxin
MADKKNKYPDNAPGRFYVDDTCNDCAACRATAPENFSRNDDGGYAFVSKQPENDEELQLCVEAMDGCPCVSIGDDGDR